MDTNLVTLASPLVRAFLAQLPCSSEVDDCLFNYLVAALLDDDVDLEELDEMMSGVLPSFEAMPSDARLSMLLDVYHQVKDLRARDASGKSNAPADKHSHHTQQQQQQQQAQQTPKMTTADEAPAMDTAADTFSDERVDQLLALCPVAVSKAFLSHLLSVKGTMQHAADFLLECQDVEAQEEEFLRHAEKQRRRQQEEAAMAERSRQNIISRFALQEIKEPACSKKGADVRPLLLPVTQDKEGPKVRYLNGAAVHVRKGEKYIIETTKEEWDGGSRGKVKTKGKRGKGFA